MLVKSSDGTTVVMTDDFNNKTPKGKYPTFSGEVVQCTVDKSRVGEKSLQWFKPSFEIMFKANLYLATAMSAGEFLEEDLEIYKEDFPNSPYYVGDGRYVRNNTVKQHKHEWWTSKRGVDEANYNYACLNC